MIRLLLLIINVVLVSKSVVAAEIFYYGPYPRDLELNSKEETLLIFPAPPIAQMCQPSNVIQVTQVSELTDMQALTIPQGNSYITGDSSGSNGLANFLKLVPTAPDKKTNCSIRLSNGDTVAVNIGLSASVQRPVVEFKGLKEEGVIEESAEAATLFKQFVGGGKLTSFKDISPNEETRIKMSDKGTYQIDYTGTNQTYNAWIVSVSFSKNSDSIFKLKKVRPGEIYFSAIIEKGVLKAVETISSEKSYTLYILTRSDIGTKELMEKLP